MPNQVIPINNLTEVGLIEDMPSVALPPNAFSDVDNVRFHNGAVRKFPGESANLLPSTAPASVNNIKYVASWSSPSGLKYIVVSHTDSAVMSNIEVFDSNWMEIGQFNNMPVASGFEWQHTEFNGGFHLVLNNGVSTPRFLQDNGASAAPVFAELPGWDSYLVEETLFNFQYDGTPSGFQDVSYRFTENTTLKISNVPRDISQAIVTGTLTIPVTDNMDGTFTPVPPADTTIAGVGTISMVTPNGFRFTPASGTNGGTSFNFTVVAGDPGTVTAGVIRSYGNLLVAGNLRETTTNRTLTGTIRTSNVAAPGDIPQNWNPFALGVNTADEFVLASTGTVRDMVELQGILYIYTDTSIHAVQQTGSPQIPFQISPVTSNYGADNVNSVVEVDGKHIVIGSDDVYVFAGHPGSISSIADGRVRNNFRDNKGYKVVRFNKWDELWFWRPNTAEMYVWNYRTNVWTKRSGSIPVSLNSTTGDLLLASSSMVVNVDEGFSMTSMIERTRLAITPEFDTENLASIALLVDGQGQLNIRAIGTNDPGNIYDLDTAPSSRQVGLSSTMFQIDGSDAEYKQDIRVHGRFLNYRMTHTGTTEMNLTGMQFDIGKGGRR